MIKMGFYSTYMGWKLISSDELSELEQVCIAPIWDGNFDFCRAISIRFIKVCIAPIWDGNKIHRSIIIHAFSVCIAPIWDGNKSH